MSDTGKSRTNTTTPPNGDELKVFGPNMLQLNTLYGFTLNPKDQQQKKNHRFKIMTSAFFQIIRSSGLTEYKFYPEISSPDASLEKSYKKFPRWHFHGYFQITNIIDYITFYEYGFNKLASFGALEIHHKLNYSYPVKNEKTMKPICKHLKLPWIMDNKNVAKKLEDKDFENLGKDIVVKIKDIFLENEEDFLEDDVKE